MYLDLVSDNSTSQNTRSSLINDTVQRELDSLAGDEPERKRLIEKIVEETVEREQNKIDFATRIRPDLHQAMLDTISSYGWTNVIYMYSTNEGGL
jgi:hypothetical protein